MRRAAGFALVALALLAGCGDEDASGGGEGPAESNRYVDKSKPPFVNALDVDPSDGSLLMTTNRGFFRIDPEKGTAERIEGTVSAKGKSSPVGTFLAFVPTGPDTLIGSGHPDDGGSGLPQFLGVLRSDDGGRRWEVTARLGLADLHVLRPLHGRIYAFDAVVGALLISEDGGRTYDERFTPKSLMLDFVVDPEDPDYVLALDESTLFRTDDGGETWRPLGPSESARLAWPAPDALYRANSDGTVLASDDRGRSFTEVGKLDGEPWRLKALDGKRIYAALADATIQFTDDGGRTWRTVFEP